MSYNDKKFGPLLPTRTGTPIGGSGERQMLDRLSGSEGYRKGFRTNPDGTTTMLTTKNGMPRFQDLGKSNGSDIDSKKFRIGLASGAVRNDASGNTYYTRTTQVASYASPGDKVKAVDWIDQTLFGNQPKDKSVTTAIVSGDSNIIQRCPSSLFTGKMRLYVQCLYGNLGKLPAELSMNDDGFTIPSLSYGGVVLNTSCGILWDQSTRKHYLISVTTGAAHELARPAFLDDIANKLGQSGTGSETPEIQAKLEAYLLSQSYPSSAQGIDLPPRIAGGMGYGWHFNWAGTMADCVGIDSSTKDLDGTPCYKSTHWRITFSVSNGRIQGSLAQVGASKWRNKRGIRNICFPLWDMSGFLRIGFKFLPEFGSGPLYAYYSHTTDIFPGSSQLQVVTWAADMGVPVPLDGTMWPDYMNAGTLMVCGTDECGYEIRPAHECDTFTISSGGAVVTVTSSYEGRSVTQVTGGSSDLPDRNGYWWKSDVPLSAYGNQPPYLFDSGRPSPIPLYRSPQAWNAGGGQIRNVGDFAGEYVKVAGSSNGNQYAYTSNRMNATVSKEVFGRATVKDGYLIGFPPYFDAEAYYMWSRQDQVDGENGNSITSYGTGFRTAYAVGSEAAPPTTIVSTYDGFWDPLSGGGVGTAFTREIRTQGIPLELLVCGSVSATPNTPLNYIPFLDSSNDVAGVAVNVQSSTRLSVYSATLNIDVGNAPLSFGSGWAAYTGWA